jgi:hypothetical protein
MENLFGTSFCSVRLHVGPEAEQLGVPAFCFGEHLFLGPWLWDAPGARRLAVLAHELTHVVQQRLGLAGSYGEGEAVLVRSIGLEVQAVRAARQALSGERIAIAPAGRTMFASPPSSMIAQLYHEDGQGFRMSEDRRIKVKGQEFFAHGDLIDQANEQLEEVNSLVRLEKKDHGLRPGGLIRVGPIWVPEEGRQQEHRALNDSNGEGIPYITWSDCHRNSTTVMGVRKKPLRGQDEFERGVAQLVEGEGRTWVMPVRKGVGDAEFTNTSGSSDLAQRIAYSVLNCIIREGQDRETAPTPAQIEDLWQQYVAMVGGERSAAWESTHKVNRFIAPRAGEALVILPATADKTNFKSTYAFNNLKERVGAELVSALGLSEDNNYASILKKMTADYEKDPKLTREQDKRLRDRMILTHLKYCLSADSCVLQGRQDILAAIERGETADQVIGRIIPDGDRDAMTERDWQMAVHCVRDEYLCINASGMQRDATTWTQLRDMNQSETPNSQVWPDFLRTKIIDVTFKQVWNFHWAGVIMATDDHFVTLENLSVGAEEYPNRRWYFRLHRLLSDGDATHESQTFHNENMLSGGFGDLGLTLSVKYFPPPARAVLAPARQHGGSTAFNTFAPATGSGGGTQTATEAEPTTYEAPKDFPAPCPVCQEEIANKFAMSTHFRRHRPAKMTGL